MTTARPRTASRAASPVPRVTAGERQMIGVVTQRGGFVGNSELDQYAITNGRRRGAVSRQIKDPFTSIYGETGLIEPLYAPLALAQLLELNTYHARASRTKAQDVAGLGIEVVPSGPRPEIPKLGDPGVTPELVASATEARAAFDTEGTTLRAYVEALDPALQETFTEAALDFEAIGWATVEAIREGNLHKGVVGKLKHIPAHTMRMHRDEDHMLQLRGTRKVWFKRIGAKSTTNEGDVHEGEDFDLHWKHGTKHPFGELSPDDRATEVLFWKNYTPRSDYYGLPDIIPAIGAITGDLKRRDYNLSFFDNYGVPAYAVFITGNYDAGTAPVDTVVGSPTFGQPIGPTPLEASIRTHFEEFSKKPRSTLVVAVPSSDQENPAVIHVEKLAVDVEESSFRMYRQDNRDEVLAAHGVDPYRLGIAEVGALGGNTAAESRNIYKESVVDPRQGQIERLLNKWVVADGLEITSWKVKFADLDDTDETAELALWEQADSIGAVSAEEFRRRWADRLKVDPAMPDALREANENRSPDMGALSSMLDAAQRTVAPRPPGPARPGVPRPAPAASAEAQPATRRDVQRAVVAGAARGG